VLMLSKDYQESYGLSRYPDPAFLALGMANGGILPYDGTEVVVLNLWKNDGTSHIGEEGYEAQDVLYLNPTAVPEPATLFLIGLGLLGARYARRWNWDK